MTDFTEAETEPGLEPWQIAREQADAHIRNLHEMATTAGPSQASDVIREAALLSAWSNREITSTMVIAAEVGRRSSAASDTNLRLLVKWTKVLALATVLVAIAAFGILFSMCGAT